MPLAELLKQVSTGKVQLPDFQREWKWDTDRIAGLLATVAQGHPLGVVMTLEVGGADVRFAPKPLAGVDPAATAAPEQLLLDGQQRLTSLYQALYSPGPVETKDSRDRRIDRWYYIDMAQALVEDADLEEAIVAVPADRIVRDDFGRRIVRDYTTTALECAAEMFPFAAVFDQGAVNQWMVTYLQLDTEVMAARLERWTRFHETVLNTITNYTVPVIKLTKETPKEAVCTVFEKVNTGGVPLNVFELLTATFAGDDFRLNDDWKARQARLEKRPVLRAFESTDFLQAITLLTTWTRRKQHLASKDANDAPGVSCKRRDILRLTLAEYQQWAEPVTAALEWCYDFLAQERIFRAADLPYRTQLVPLAAIRVALGGEADTQGVRALLHRWFWCGVLGEMYGGATESRFARDLEQVVPWATGVGGEPSTVADASFQSARLLTLRTRNSAAYKGVYALLMRADCLDWVKHQPMSLASFFDYKVDIHHIFPKDWCGKNGVDRVRQESIVNKTAISYDTNRSIGGRSPAEYVKTLEAKAKVTPAQVDAVLATHLVDSVALRAADFDGFFRRRRAALIALISDAMGKPVNLDEDELAEAAAYEPDVEEPSDDDLVALTAPAAAPADGAVVFTTKAGSRFHLAPDCFGIVGGQNGARSQGMETFDVEAVPPEAARQRGLEQCALCRPAYN